MVVFAKSTHFAVVFSVVTVCYGFQLNDNFGNFVHEVINMTNSSLYKVDTVLAPFTIWNLFFTMALAAGGETARQLLSVLGLSHEKENILIRANKELNKNLVQTGDIGESYASGSYIFWDKEFEVNPEFKAILNYGLEIENQVLDFSESTAAAATANGVIANPLESILKEGDFATSRMILVSSTSFEGLWMLPFNALDTTIEPFYSEKGEIVRQVYMMNQRNRFPFSNIEELDAFVLQLPYGANDKYCMLILLPSLRTNVSEVYRNLVHSFTIKDVFYKLNNDTKSYGLDKIDIKIPRFEISTNRGAIYRLLNDKSANDIYDSTLANFSRASSEPIFVSSIKLGNNIKVTETGTSASAFASVFLTNKEVFSPPISGTVYYKPNKLDPVYSPAFIVNRPFIYYVIEKATTAVLFGGAFLQSVVF